MTSSHTTYKHKYQPGDIVEVEFYDLTRIAVAKILKKDGFNKQGEPLYQIEFGDIEGLFKPKSGLEKIRRFWEGYLFSTKQIEVTTESRKKVFSEMEDEFK